MEKKEIIKILKKQNIDFKLDFLDNKEIILIKSCDLGENNFYDYGEKEPKLTIDNSKLEFLEDCDNVAIIRCCDCGKCSGW